MKTYPVAAAPWGVVTGPDGKLWYTNEGGTQGYGWLTVDGQQKKHFTNLPSNSLPVDIVAGPDRHLWLIANGQKISRVSTSGQVQNFKIPVAGANLGGLAVGPDDNIWFTDMGTDAVGKLTPNGTVKEYPLVSGTSPVDITSGPDGRLWFTERGTHMIGTIKTDGSGYHEYDSTLPTSSLQYIAAGPDGDLWFTAAKASSVGVDAIGQISTAGAVNTFTANLTVGSWPEGIASGWDGNLWFTELSTSGHVAATTTAGQIAEYGPINDGGVIAPGIDGNMWAAASGSNTLNRVDDTNQVGVAYDLVRDNFFTPVKRHASLGGKVKWMFLGPNTHSVTDSSGMQLFGSGSMPIVSYFTHRFHAAGTYAYHSVGDAGMKGSVAVPLEATPATGTTSTAFELTWADGKAPAGFVYDVEIKRPGDSHFRGFRTGVTSAHSSYTPTKGSGKYEFRSRLRKKSNGDHTGWSPIASVKAT